MANKESCMPRPPTYIYTSVSCSLKNKIYYNFLGHIQFTNSLSGLPTHDSCCVSAFYLHFTSKMIIFLQLISFSGLPTWFLLLISFLCAFFSLSDHFPLTSVITHHLKVRCIHLIIHLKSIIFDIAYKADEVRWWKTKTKTFHLHHFLFKKCPRNH